MGSVRSTGLCERDTNSRQTGGFQPELRPEAAASGGGGTMGATKMTPNLKSLLLTMTMFKWGRRPHPGGLVCGETQHRSC